MATELPKFESRLYLLIWSLATFYAIYNVSFTRAYFSNYNDVYSDFSPGWTWIGLKKDVSDQEWQIWIPFLIKLIPWIIAHHIVSYVIKRGRNRVLQQLWYTILPIIFLCYYVGMSATLCIIVEPCFSFVFTYTKSKICIWIIHILFLFVINFLKMPDGVFQSILNISDEQHYMVILTICWIFLRSISYNIDIIEHHNRFDYNSVKSSLKNILHKLAYCLFLPTLSLGPLVIYEDFRYSINLPCQSWNIKKLKHFTFNLVRYIFWIFFTDFSLHFIYVNVLQYHPEIVRNLNPWALYGLGYCMGQFFFNKYVVVYGINGNLCALEDVKAPPQPKCIGRIHLYSDMWKFFDRGLYIFLIRYIYSPVRASGLNKFIASFLCFSFIFLWHGMQMNIFTWAFLNFLGLNIEEICKTIGKTKTYGSLQRIYLSPQNVRRLNCALASPLLAMSAVSNFYFFAGQEIGNIYVERILHESWNTLFILLFFLYCCCQVSMDMKNREMRRCDS